MAIGTRCFIRGQMCCAKLIVDRLNAKENLLNLVRVSFFIHGDSLLAHELHQLAAYTVGSYEGVVVDLRTRVLLVRGEVHQTRVS